MRLFGRYIFRKNLIDFIPYLKEIETDFTNAKIIRKENIHITWVFLGEVNEEKLKDLNKTINNHIEVFKRLIFQSSNLELWPTKKHPRLIVLTGNLNKLIDLKGLKIILHGVIP